MGAILLRWSAIRSLVQMPGKELVDCGEGLGIGADTMPAAVLVKLKRVLDAKVAQPLVESRQAVAEFRRLGIAGVEKHGGGVLGEIVRRAVDRPAVAVFIAFAPRFLEAREHRGVRSKVQIVIPVAMNHSR